ncbi:uncharacterized protein FYW61_011505 [Anableps anableps]
MCSPLNMREFIRQRLTAAAEEIFRVFEKTVIQYEEELDRQRRLMEMSWKTTQRQQKSADLPQKHVHLEKEEVPAEQLLCNLPRSSSLDQEDPEPPQVKEEQEEPCSSLQTDQLQPKEESDTFLVTLLYGGGKPREPEENCHGLQSLHQEGGEDVDPGSRSNTEQMGQKRPEDDISETTNEDIYPVSESQSDSEAGIISMKCGFCGKVFRNKSQLKMHHMIHSEVKPYVCNDCGKSFKDVSLLRYHRRTHSDERPYSCEMCGKSFRCNYSLSVHMRTHTGEKPYLCNTCGKRFTNPSAFKWHTAIHVGDRRYSCEICGKSFIQNGNLKAHMMTHTGEKKHSCKTCGKSFSRSNNLIVHIRTHTGEKPYPCSTCGERFQYAAVLKKHSRMHIGTD